MADETDSNGYDDIVDDESGRDDIEQADGEDSAGGKDSADDATVGDPTDQDTSSDASEPGSDPAGLAPEEMRERLQVSRATMNMLITGLLVIHHESRDVRLGIDGDTAIRVIAWFAGGCVGKLDSISREASSAAFGWSSFDPNGVIGVSWVPEGHRGLDPVVFDPVSAGV